MGVSIQQLKQEIDKVQAELHQENQRGALKDSHKVSEIEAKLADLSQRLDVEQRLNQHETKVEESQTEIAYFMDTLNVDGITMRELCQNEEAYQLLRAVVQGTMLERDENRLNEQKELELQNASLKAEKEQMQQRYDSLYEESTNQRKEIHQLQVELEDAQNKHSAAVAELEDSRKEVERLNSHVDDLRKEIAVGAAGATKTVDVAASLEQYKRKLQEEKENKIIIYNVQPLDHRRSKFQAQYAENDEVFVDSYLYFGNYREVTAEEAEQFRRSTEKSNGETVATPGESVEESVVPVNLQFQEDENDEHGLDEGDTDREVEAEATGSVKEQLAALEQRVSVLEGLMKGEAA